MSSSSSSSNKEFFPDVPKILYKGPDDSNTDPLSFRHYNPDEVILGKPMKEWLRFSVCFWHTFRGGGGLDPFGSATWKRPWEDDLADDPMDLGAEVEMYMGPELERHTFTESTVIYIPPNFIHAPWRPLKVDKPFLFIEVNQGPEHTEKFYPQLLPKEARDKIDWSMWPDKGF